MTDECKDAAINYIRQRMDYDNLPYADFCLNEALEYVGEGASQPTQ
jgi:hypothetical protein